MRRRLWLVAAALLVLLAVLILPPLVSISRYKSQIAHLISASLGRPVHLSSLHMHLLPRPGFVLYDLTVDEDPAFGAEPVLHASSVTAVIRMLSLWRGRLEIDEISVDDASLNVVRTPDGRWNLDSLLQATASNASKAADGGKGRALPLPYLAATNSRINFKSGVEKLPFSLVDTDLSFRQASPGEWRIRLRGQPARTDVSLEQGDTGIVELDASVRRAPDLRQMPMHIDLDWRNAQLGQLTRLVTGSDAGWRGDMRGELHLDGAADAAHITTRLRATGVHRVEFAPVEPMDFDANCSLVYHYSARAIENLACDSPIGDGHIHIAGEAPGGGAMPHYSVEMDKVPAGAALEALRTFRSGVDPSLQAAGDLSGKIAYAENPEPESATNKPEAGAKRATASAAKPGSTAVGPAAAGPLTGSLTVEGLTLTGGGLSQPLQAPKFVLAPEVPKPIATKARKPAFAPEPQSEQTQALVGEVALPAGAPVPLNAIMRFGPEGYQVTLRGQASIQRGKELAHAAGLAQAAALDQLAGDSLVADMIAEGPWLPAEDNLPAEANPAASDTAEQASGDETTPKVDSLSGTVTLRNANWKADYLANHVQIAEAALHVDESGLRWDPIEFAYGPLKGTATLSVKKCATPAACSEPQVPEFTLQFGSLDVAKVQTAILGAHAPGTLLSDLINRLHPSTAPAWPRINGVVKVDSLLLGPVTLQNASFEMHILPASVEIASLDGTLLGGTVHGTGTLTSGDKPGYALTGDFAALKPAAIGQMLGGAWRGGSFDASGKLELAGYTGDDLASSAKGTLHFDWRHGSVSGAAAPPALAHFDRWSGDAAIGGGKIALGQNEAVLGSRKSAVDGSVTLEEKPKLTFAAKPAPAKKP